MIRQRMVTAAAVAAGALTLVALPASASTDVAAPSPGQTAVGKTATPQNQAAAVPCPQGNFCAYPSRNYGGTPVKAYNCGQYYRITFTGIGSYINNQYGRVRARYYDQNKKFISYSAYSYAAVTSKNWTPIFYIVPC